MLTDPSFVMLIAAVFLFAGVIKGTIGIGLPTVSVGIMSQFIAPHTAIACVVFPLLISNVWQVYRAGDVARTVQKYWVLACVLAGSLWITTLFAAQVSAHVLLGAIGIAIVVFAASSLIGTPPELPDKYDRPAQIIAGATAGILGGFTSIWSPPFVTYLIARRTDGEEFVRVAGLLLVFGGVPLAIGFWQTGLLNGTTAPLSLGLVIPTLAGFTIGEMIRRRMNPAKFRKTLLWLFLLMGLNLLRRAFF